MEIQTSIVDHINIVEIIGELDGQTSPIAQARIIPLCQVGSKLLLDMSRVTYLSSMGLQLILLIYHQMARVNGHMAIIGLHESLRETLAMMGFLPQLVTYHTQAEGIAGLKET